jgi:hypothetical protein
MAVTTGRFASQALRTDWEEPLCTTLVGRRFDQITVRATFEDFHKENVQKWLKQLGTRVSNIYDYKISITILPPPRTR